MRHKGEESFEEQTTSDNIRQPVKEIQLNPCWSLPSEKTHEWYTAITSAWVSDETEGQRDGSLQVPNGELVLENS